MSVEAKIGCALTCLLIIVAAILIGVSFNRLEPNEVGLDYSANSLTLDTSKFYSAGIHFLGVGHSFVKFPRKVQEIEMQSDAEEIIARTSDGLTIAIQCKLLYRLFIEVERLASLYLMFKGEEATIFKAIARSVIRDVSSRFTAFEFWRSRDNITSAMIEELGPKFKDVHATLDAFLMGTVELPDLFNRAIKETDEQRQEKEKVIFEQDKARTDTRTDVTRADYEVTSMLIEANATAASYALDVDAEITKINYTIASELQSYQLLQRELQLSPEELARMVWLDTLSKLKSHKAFALQTPSLLKRKIA